MVVHRRQPPHASSKLILLGEPFVANGSGSDGAVRRAVLQIARQKSQKMNDAGYGAERWLLLLTWSIAVRLELGDRRMVHKSESRAENMSDAIRSAHDLCRQRG